MKSYYLSTICEENLKSRVVADFFGLYGRIVFSAICAMALDAVAFAPPQWPEVSRDAKPWAYNWWMGSAVDAEGIEAQCKAMKEAGMGGFHVIPIYGARGYENRYRKYLSPDWMVAFKMAVDTAGKYALGVDMTMGSGWCFGGPQLVPEYGAWKVETVPDGKPPYIKWSLTEQKVKRGGLGGVGPMMDPYSCAAMDAFISPFTEAFDAPGAAKPLNVYHDSWEYYGAGWTPGFFDIFKKKRGYDLRDKLKEFAGNGDPDEIARVKCDYRETLSDIVIEDTFPKWVEWAHKRGIGTRNEAHGASANWLDFYALCDIPETEMFAEECRNILVSKFASSAANVSGKKLVSAESCTWLGEHFTETLQDFKVFVDRLFLSGVNHIYYHGCCYSPVDAVWPGWTFYASSQMNPRNPIWRDAVHLNAYFSRCQSMFQSCTPDNDTLVYWPLRDYWWDAEGFEMRMSVHNATNWFERQPIGVAAAKLYEQGYAFDYVSDRQLQQLDLSRYSELVVPPCRRMPKKTAEAVARFKNRGAKREPFPEGGICFTRFRRGNDTVYFLVNTNSFPVCRSFRPTAAGDCGWLMDPMNGKVCRAENDGKAFRLSFEKWASLFLVVREGEPFVPNRETVESATVVMEGAWEVEPVCGGPELPSKRRMKKLTSWSVNEDGSENPFCGTMRYCTHFKWNGGLEGEAVLDLGEVLQSARVRVNGRDAGFTFMSPFKVRFPASLLVQGENQLEIEVTSTGANRIRWNDINGVNWKYFYDANVIAYGYKGRLDASKWPLRPNGLLGPVKLSVADAVK